MENLKAPSQPQSTASSPTLKLEAAKCAKILLGCYRTGDANDPEVYVQSAIAVLSEYPLEVMKAVSDPRSGLPAKSKWLPTVFEIKDACEAAMAPIDRRRREELAREERRLALSAPVVPRPTLDEMKAQYGDDWGLGRDVSEAVTIGRESRAAHIQSANETLLRNEYARAGVEMIEAAPGIPVSLQLARKIGRRQLIREKT